VNVIAAGPSVTLSIYDWTSENFNNVSQGSHADIVGSPLFQTSIQTATSAGASGDFTDVTVSPGINLLPNASFGIAILDESTQDSLASWAFGLTPYAGGERFDRIATANHWSGHGGEDFAFKAAFVADPATPVPEPASIALFGIGAAGLIGFHRRKKQQAA
jgi:hypothetical protein